MKNSRILSLISAIVAALVTIGGMMMLTGMFLSPPTADLGYGFALGVVLSGFTSSYKHLNPAQRVIEATSAMLALVAVAIAFSWASQSGLYELVSNDFMSGFVVATILGLTLTFAQSAVADIEEEAE